MSKCILVVQRHKTLQIILAIVDRESGDPVNEGNLVDCSWRVALFNDLLYSYTA